MILSEGVLISCRQVISCDATRVQIRVITFAVLPVRPPEEVDPMEFTLLKASEGSQAANEGVVLTNIRLS